MSLNEPLIVEQAFTSSVDNVWKAITDVSLMRQWFFENIPSFKPEEGFTTKFNVHANNNDYLHLWRLTEVVPEKRITYNWRYGGYPGDSFVTFELSRQGDQTKLRLTHTGIESFPQDNPDFSRESCREGWRYFICQRLKVFLNQG